MDRVHRLACAGAGLTLFAPNWDTYAQDDDVRFLPNRFTSRRAYELMEKAFKKEVQASSLIFALENQDAPLTDEEQYERRRR